MAFLVKWHMTGGGAALSKWSSWYTSSAITSLPYLRLYRAGNVCVCAWVCLFTNGTAQQYAQLREGGVYARLVRVTHTRLDCGAGSVRPPGVCRCCGLLLRMRFCPLLHAHTHPHGTYFSSTAAMAFLLSAVSVAVVGLLKDGTV